MCTTTQQKLNLTDEQKEILATPKKFFEFLKEKYYVKDGDNPHNHFIESIIIDAPCFHTDRIKSFTKDQKWQPEFAILLEDEHRENASLKGGEFNLVFGVENPVKGTGWSRLVAVESSVHQYGQGEAFASCCYELLSSKGHFEKRNDALAEMCYITAFFKLMEEFLAQLA